VFVSETLREKQMKNFEIQRDVRKFEKDDFGAKREADTMCSVSIVKLFLIVRVGIEYEDEYLSGCR
jgi:hypothetical protein